MTGAIDILFHIVVAVALIGFLRGALRSGAAVGLFWDFLREREPVRYWIYLAFIALWAAVAAIEAVGGLFALVGPALAR
ncbi:MAG TPA: hypothetical protein VGB79_01935 [Allosphingosinicella sp.]